MELFVTKSAKIEIGLCEKHANRRKRFIYIAWGVFAAFAIMIITAFATSSPILGLGAVMLLILDLGFVAITTNIVTPVRIDNHYVHITGVCANFLENLPEWLPGK